MVLFCYNFTRTDSALNMSSTRIVQSDPGRRTRRFSNISFFEERPKRIRRRWRPRRGRSPPPAELQGHRVFEEDLSTLLPDALNILAAIYWDINFVSLLHRVTKISPEENSIEHSMVNVYETEHNEADAMAKKVAERRKCAKDVLKNGISHTEHWSLDPVAEPCLSINQKCQREIRRLEWFVFRHGWKMLAILAHFQGFSTGL